MPGFSVLHYLLEFAQTHVHWVSGNNQSTHSLLAPFPPALNCSQHQGPFQWVGSASGKSKFNSVGIWINLEMFFFHVLRIGNYITLIYVNFIKLVCWKGKYIENNDLTGYIWVFNTESILSRSLLSLSACCFLASNPALTNHFKVHCCRLFTLWSNYFKCEKIKTQLLLYTPWILLK